MLAAQLLDTHVSYMRASLDASIIRADLEPAGYHHPRAVSSIRGAVLMMCHLRWNHPRSPRRGTSSILIYGARQHSCRGPLLPQPTPVTLHSCQSRSVMVHTSHAPLPQQSTGHHTHPVTKKEEEQDHFPLNCPRQKTASRAWLVYSINLQFINSQACTVRGWSTYIGYSSSAGVY